MSRGSPSTLPISGSPLREAGAVPPHAMAGYASIGQYHVTHLLGAAFPAAAGLALFGWRALLMLLVMLVTAMTGVAVWRQIGARGNQLRAGFTVWPTVLLWLMLPGHLLQNGDNALARLWAIPVAAALLLVMVMWVLASSWLARIPAAAVTYLVLAGVFGAMLMPTAVLQRNKLFGGDVTRAAEPPQTAYIKDGYLKAEPMAGADAVVIDPPARKLLAFTSGREKPGRSRLSLESLLRDQMPPLEDLIIGGYPGPTGATCAIAVIIGGLFLLYRGVIDYRVPLAIVVGAYAAFLTLPIPVLIREQNEAVATTQAGTHPTTAPKARPVVAVTAPAGGSATQPGRVAGGAKWRWMAFRDPIEVGWAKAITFANYEVMAGPMLLMTFFVATWPGVRPMPRRSRPIFGLLVGVLAAGLQIYVSVSWGPYLALLIVSLLSPALDRLFRQRALV